MKIIGINGSPHKEGNTYFALKTIADTLREEGFDMQIIHIGNKTVRGCLGCGMCARNKNEKCITDDIVNQLIPTLKNADAIILGSPVYYAGIAGTMKCFCDRLFYVASANGGLFKGKIGAGIVAARRGGASAAFSGLNYFLHLAQMIMPGSSYWNSIHGAKPLEAEGDGEGIQTMQNLAKNIAWLLRLKAAGKDIPLPQYDAPIRTNFIR